MEIEMICGNCGEPIDISAHEIRNGKIILTLNQEHVCYPEYDDNELKHEWWAFPSNQFGDPLDDSELTVIFIAGEDHKSGDCVEDESGLHWSLYKKGNQDDRI